jgi:hypothetical protein
LFSFPCTTSLCSCFSTAICKGHDNARIPHSFQPLLRQCPLISRLADTPCISTTTTAKMTLLLQLFSCRYSMCRPFHLFRCALSFRTKTGLWRTCDAAYIATPSLQRSVHCWIRRCFDSRTRGEVTASRVDIVTSRVGLCAAARFSAMRATKSYHYRRTGHYNLFECTRVYSTLQEVGTGLR